MTECKFCEEYEGVKALEHLSEYKNNYYAAMITKPIFNGKEKGYWSHNHHELNYCPVCGKKLEDE